MAKIFYYMQHLMGVGHVFRSMRIARALIDQGHDLEFVYGGEPIPNFDLPGGKIHYLPPLRAGSVVFKDMETPEGIVADDAYKAKRTGQILAIFQAQQPDVVLTETFPLGRRQMRFELLPLLDAVKAGGRPVKVLSSIRDILQENWKPERYEEACGYVETHYDHILVHGDRRLAALEDTFPLYERIADRLVYTGIVAPDDSDEEEEATSCDVVVSVGGGLMGKELLLAAVEAKRLSCMADAHWLVAHGVNMDPETINTLKTTVDEKTTLVPFLTNLRGVMSKARLSVSRCGYNTVADIFRSGTRSVVVPLSDGTETEQLRRGDILKAAGLSGVVHPDEMTPQSLAAEIDRVMAEPPPDRSGYDLDGAVNSARLIGMIAEGKTLPPEVLSR